MKTKAGSAVMGERDKNIKIMEWAMSFWMGVGLMSLINVWKMTQGKDPALYSWVMAGISAVFIAGCLIYMKSMPGKGAKGR
jgi:predicted membrane channel-forming protein YqfA (hemolysin III family)